MFKVGDYVTCKSCDFGLGTVHEINGDVVSVSWGTEVGQCWIDNHTEDDLERNEYYFA